MSVAALLHYGPLTEPSGPWLLTFSPRQLENLSFFFSEKAYAGHPGFHRFRALGSLQFLLEYSLEWKSKNTIVPLLLDRMPLHASEGEIHLY